VAPSNASTDACFVALGVRCSVYEQAYVKASNSNGGDYFGFALALDGDTLAVGAYGESGAARGVNGDQTNEGAVRSGAVYVFVRGSAGWTQQAYLKASNADAEDYFGWSLSLDGDTLAVGARNEDSAARGVNGDQANNSTEGSSAAYVFVRSGSVWTQQAYLKASNADKEDLFGWTVALDGDTLAVGAPGEASAARGVNGDQTNNAAKGSGAVYVFARSGSVWTQQAYLKASNTDNDDEFGESLALEGDTLAVGARGEASAARGVNGDQENNADSVSGAVYVFVRTTAGWTQQAYLKASNSSGGFGACLALDADTLAVGAPMEHSAAQGVNGDQENRAALLSGAVYVFVRTSAGWTQQAYLKASNTGADDAFGSSVALEGDTLAVGAPDEGSTAQGVNGDQGNNAANESGAVYLFVRGPAGWTQRAYLKATNTNEGDKFGYTLALDKTTLAVGAVREASNARGVNGDQSNNGERDSGAVYLRQIAP
jgi:hypothetical protein